MPAPTQSAGSQAASLPGRSTPADDWEARVRDGISGGRPLADEERSHMERSTGVDLSEVRLHDDARADDAARSIQARAFTVGDHVAFRSGEYHPHTTAGRRLLTHELSHVVQQRGRGRSSSRGVVRRAIEPEDVASEMVGRKFELTAAFTARGTTLAAGTRVTIAAWVNTSETVEVTAPAVAGRFTVPKSALAPVHTAAAGVHPYSTGVPGQAASVVKGEKALADWLAKEAQYKSPKAKALFAEERKRLEDLQAVRQESLNRKLIQETMYNRFDGTIRAEVAAANRADGLSGRDALDPNLVKAMLFQESEMGTSGTHLEDPPSHAVRSRFNIGQVVDSSGIALLTLLEAEHPAIVRDRAIGGLRRDLADAQRELKKLKAKASRTAAEEAQLVDLEAKAERNWEIFIWRYPGFAAAVGDLFAGAAPARNLDYDFWIHLAVMWLFKKRRAGMSWDQAVKAYNGGGARAEHYRRAVVARATGAAAAAKAGKLFTPTR